MASVSIVFLPVASILAAGADDSAPVGGVIAAAVLALVSLVSVPAPRALWRVTNAWRFRNADAMEPSARYFRVTRLGAAISLTLWSAFFAVGVVPGDIYVKVAAALITASVGLVLMVIAIIVGFLARRAQRAKGKNDPEPPVNELSEAGYLDQYVGVGISAVALVVLMLILAGIPGQIETARLDRDARAQQRADQASGNYGVFYPVSREIVGAVEPGAFMTDPEGYTIADAATKEPAYLWDLQPTMESIVGQSRTIDEAAAQSDVVLMARQGCSVDSLVVIETDDAVAIGMEVGVPQLPGMPAPTATAAPDGVSAAERVCSIQSYGTPRGYYFVTLPGGPLGNRTLTTLDGTPIPLAE